MVEPRKCEECEKDAVLFEDDGCGWCYGHAIEHAHQEEFDREKEEERTGISDLEINMYAFEKKVPTSVLIQTVPKTQNITKVKKMIRTKLTNSEKHAVGKAILSEINFLADILPDSTDKKTIEKEMDLLESAFNKLKLVETLKRVYQ